MKTTATSNFLAGGGEMGRLIRAKEWSYTDLGNPDSWPTSLQTILAVILHSKFPMFVWWGPDLICFYNDAYRPSLGRDGKHPWILGQPAKQAWPEIWPVISPLIQQVLDGGESTWSEDQLIPIYRNGTLEDVYWTFSYSRINDDFGKPNGVLVTCVETTEKVLNQKQLEETYELLKFSTEAADLGTWDYNPTTGRFIANSHLKQWFGIDLHGEMELQSAIDAIIPGDRERVTRAIENSIDYNLQAPYDIEYTIANKKTGKETVVLVKGKPFFDEQGVAYRFSGIMEDITEKNMLRNLREESAQNLRNVVEQSPVAMCVLKGPQHVVEIANEKMVTLWGKKAVDVMHKPIFEGLPEAKEQGLEKLLDDVFRTGVRYTAQDRAVNLPRESVIQTVYQNFVYEPLRGDDGVIEGVIAVTIDVTEQVIARRKVEEAEERARLAIEAANLGTFDFLINEKIAIISPRFAEIFEADPSSTHMELVNRIHPDDRSIRDKAFEEAMKTGLLFYEVRLVKQNGNISWVRAQGKVVLDDKGSPYRVLGTVMDFTDIKALEQKREEYMAIVSHELKNPLTSLKLSLDLLNRNPGEKDGSFLLEKAGEQVARLVAMTSDLLSVSKISAGMLDITPEIFHLGNSIRDSIATVQAGMNTDNFTITGLSDISLSGDRFRIEQVLVNLLSNAVKYSPKNSPIIINVDQQNNFVKISVSDRGLGIDSDKINLIFQKFSRIETGKGIEGHGLGLYISRQIIRKHGGDMGVESEKGKGSNFWFTIPF